MSSTANDFYEEIGWFIGRLYCWLLVAWAAAWFVPNSSGQLVIFLALLVSPGAMGYVSNRWEKRGPLRLYGRNFKSFIPGDILLAIAFAYAADNYHHTHGAFFQHWSWHLLMLPVGLVAGKAFRRMEHPSRSSYVWTQYFSPTKLTHDWLSLPAMFMIGFTVLPATFTNGQQNAALIVGLFLAWLAMVVYDNRHFQYAAHPVYDWVEKKAHFMPGPHSAASADRRLKQKYNL